MKVERTDPPGRKRSGHWYKTDHANHEGKTLPSVTAITGIMDKPALVNAAVKLDVEAMAGLALGMYMGDRREYESWLEPLVKAAKTYHKDIWDSAAQEGTEAHEFVARYLDEWEGVSNDELPHSISSVVDSADLYMESIGTDIKILGVEKLVAHPFLDYAGTVDLIYLKDGVVHFADWKTGSIGYDEQAAQLAGYALAYRDTEAGTDPMPIPRCEVVHLNKSGEPGFSVKEVNMENAVPMFLAALDLWKATQKKVWM